MGSKDGYFIGFFHLPKNVKQKNTKINRIAVQYKNVLKVFVVVIIALSICFMEIICHCIVLHYLLAALELLYTI